MTLLGRPRWRTVLTTLLLAGALLTSSPATAAPSADKAVTTSRITWNGLDGARPGMNIYKAANLIGAYVERACNYDYVSGLPAGVYLNNVMFDNGRLMWQMTTTSAVAGPSGLKVGMTKKAAMRRLKTAGLKVRGQLSSETGKIDTWWAKGPEGRVVWFRLSYDAPRLSEVSLAPNRRAALRLMQHQGGC